MKTHDENKGYEVLQTISSNKNEPIGFREIKGRTGFSNDAIRYWLRTLKKIHLIGQIESVNHRDRKYYRTNLFRVKNKQEVLGMLVDTRRKERKRIQKIDGDVTAKKQKRGLSKLEKEALRKEEIKFHFLYHAASGVTFENVISQDRKFLMQPIKVTSYTTMTELLNNQVIAAIPFTPVNEILLDTLKGVALEDFSSNNTHSPITFCYLREFGFERLELEECIKELVSEGILRAVYDPKRQEMRYQIAYPLLQKLIHYDHNDLFCLLDYDKKGQSDLSSLLGNQLERIKLEWSHRKPTREEANWLGFLTSHYTGINNRSYYEIIKKTLDGNQPDKDLEKTILMLNKIIDPDPLERIRLLDTKINEIRKNVSENYYDVKDEYPYNLMLRHAYLLL